MTSFDIRVHRETVTTVLTLFLLKNFKKNFIFDGMLFLNAVCFHGKSRSEW